MLKHLLWSRASRQSAVPPIKTAKVAAFLGLLAIQMSILRAAFILDLSSCWILFEDDRKAEAPEQGRQQQKKQNRVRLASCMVASCLCRSTDEQCMQVCLASALGVTKFYRCCCCERYQPTTAATKRLDTPGSGATEGGGCWVALKPARSYCNSPLISLACKQASRTQIAAQ